MNSSIIKCPWCKINVGYLSCNTCQSKYEFVQCNNGLTIICPLCRVCKLDYFYQSDEDLQQHFQCNKHSIKRMYYYCQCCNEYLCMCVEKLLNKKKKETLNPTPSHKKKQQSI